VARILCARFPHLALIAAWRRHPELRGEAVVITGAWRGGDGPPGASPPVMAASEAAQRRGVRPGQPLVRARQHCPAAVVLAIDSAALGGLRETALTALCAVVPAVELDDEHAWCDLNGRHAVHGAEPAWSAAVARTLTCALGGEPPAVGVASTRFVAWMAARHSTPRHVRRVRPGDEAAFLAPLPVGLLPVDPAVLARLSALGLDCIGQVAGLSPADLRRQFGSEGEAVVRAARGGDDAQVAPLEVPRTAAERVVLDGSVADAEVLRRCAELACRRLGARLRELGLATLRVELVLEFESGATLRCERQPPLAVGDAGELWPVVLGLLAAVRPQAPVTALRLEAGALEVVSGRQIDLWRRGDAARGAVALAVERLRDRFGPQTVLRPRLAVDPGDLPERRFVWELRSPGEPVISRAGLT
jgi:nucleotidyltransferase/DNA polymerase involved in DNA repair